MTRSWAELPTGRVVRLHGVAADAISLAIEPLPDGSPAIVTWDVNAARSAAEMVAAVLGELQMAADSLFPAWLPGAEGIHGTGGANVHAVRALALRRASVTHHFGPFLADLAERALCGTARRPDRFAPEVRAAGLARVLADSFNRPRASIIVNVPAGLTPAEEEVLVTGCEWLAHRGEFGMWLTGAPLVSVDRVEAVVVRLPAEMANLSRDVSQAREYRVTPAMTFPAVAGIPHPASSVEKALEAALASCAWAAGRAWNQTYQSNLLTNPIRVDLLWRDEGCVVEIDGPEHLEPPRLARDQRRDAQLQSDGFAVLRFTNTEVMTQIDAVLLRMERFLQTRRSGTFEGLRHA